MLRPSMPPASSSPFPSPTSCKPILPPCTSTRVPAIQAWALANLSQLRLSNPSRRDELIAASFARDVAAALSQACAAHVCHTNPIARPARRWDEQLACTSQPEARVSVVEIRLHEFIIFDLLPSQLESAPTPARLQQLLLALVVHRSSELYHGVDALPMSSQQAPPCNLDIERHRASVVATRVPRTARNHPITSLTRR